MEAVIAGLLNIFTPEALFVVFLGTVAGLVIGALPGLSSTMGVALIIPVTFTMSPENSLIILGAVYVSSVYGGTITAILLRTPGTDASIASVFDGYPLAMNGRGAARTSIGRASATASAWD